MPSAAQQACRPGGGPSDVRPVDHTAHHAACSGIPIPDPWHGGIDHVTARVASCFSAWRFTRGSARDRPGRSTQPGSVCGDAHTATTAPSARRLRHRLHRVEHVLATQTLCSASPSSCGFPSTACSHRRDGQGRRAHHHATIAPRVGPATPSSRRPTVRAMSMAERMTVCTCDRGGGKGAWGARRDDVCVSRRRRRPQGRAGSTPAAWKRCPRC